MSASTTKRRSPPVSPVPATLRDALAKVEATPIDPGMLTPIERRFVQGEARTPAEAQQGLERLLGRSLDYPGGLCGPSPDGLPEEW